MPTGDRSSITVSDETYERLASLREERGNPKWDRFLLSLMSEPASNDSENADSDLGERLERLDSEMNALSDRLGRIEKSIDSLNRHR